MKDLRRNKRISVFLAVKVVDQKPLGDTYLLDISESGARIETLTRYASGDAIEFSFVLPDLRREISRKGQVIWVEPHPDKLQRSLVGLEFSAHWEIGARLA